MKNGKKSVQKTSILTKTVIAGAIAGFSTFNASANLFNYSSLGSGSELRSELLSINAPSNKVSEMECGKDKKTASDKAKTGEAKCGEGKAGEAKCGEGKCGDKKKETKTETKTKSVEKTKK